MKKILVLVLSLIVIIMACKKSKNVSNGSLALDKTSFSQYEVATLTASNITFSKSTYDGTFGGQAVKLGVVENKVGFLMPELAAGSYTLQTTIEGKAYTFTISVTSLPAISDPNPVIQTAFSNNLSDSVYLNKLVSITTNMPGAENSQANAQVLMTAYNNFNNQLKTATDDEKMQLAKFIAANPDIFSPFEDISIYKDSLSLYKITASSTTPEIKLSDFDAGVKIRVTKLLISSVVTIALGASTGGIAFAAGAIITIRCMYDLDDYCIINLAEIVDRIGSFSLTASKGTSSNNFTKGRQYSIYVRSDYRNLYSADISSNSTVISSIVSGLNSLHNIWDKINSYLPVTVLGATIVPKLNGESVDLSKVTTYGQKNEPVSTAFLSLQDISNSNVTATVDNSGSVLKVTFNTTATTNQDFTYNVVYTNPDADNYSQSFSGTVIVNTGHTIGESFGGGIVAYILQSGDPGYNASVQHGLIAAPSDQSTGIGWGCDSTTSSATGTAIGTGLSNTNIIVFMCGVGTAASICKNYTGGGYNDWYLPSIYELETLYNNKTTIGGFASAYYWSSSEGGMDASYGQNFANGATIYIYKYSTYSVRAIRTF